MNSICVFALPSQFLLSLMHRISSKLFSVSKVEKRALKPEVNPKFFDIFIQTAQMGKSSWALRETALVTDFR
ncbi:hypothetical protein CLOSTMETH_03766 [[Clostridium] methylpentosum DSM 5476]|uniref:Uncharacterized protein n=1 Tax=[Clostridium] methylpentosum DSM 5476 TaxID=537013 RepID=C0EIS1_9FIRM|nr:hypothetical protein CLOSTMETH_03766 [[Clostridium] methylpentosum DSM 5476]